MTSNLNLLITEDRSVDYRKKSKKIQALPLATHTETAYRQTNTESCKSSDLTSRTRTKVQNSIRQL